jgi:hypothetical protein
MGGEGVPMLEVAGAYVAVGEVNRPPVVERQRDRVVSDCGDLPGVTVQDAQPASVAARDDAIAHGECAAGRHQLVVADLP